MTLQPLRRFAMDGAILFSDILMVPLGDGAGSVVRGRRGAAPGPAAADEAAAGRVCRPQRDRLRPHLRHAVRRLPWRPCRGECHGAAMLGFAGSPWTVATYMVAGQGSKDQADARAMAWAQPGAVSSRLDRRDHRADGGPICSKQIAAGSTGGAAVRQLGGLAVARAVRPLGDRAQPAPSWSGCTTGAPGVPVIGFPEGRGGQAACAMRAKWGRTRSGWTRRSTPAGQHAALPRRPAGAGQSRPHVVVGGRRGAGRGRGDHPARAGRHRPHILQPGPRRSRSTRPSPMWSGWWRPCARPLA